LRSHRHTFRVLRFGDMADEFAEYVRVWYHRTFTNGIRFQVGLVS